MLQECPLCGAGFPPPEKCRDRFEACLVLEYGDPVSYGAVHFLTVVCYMLQHNLYSREAWLEARRMLDRSVRQGISPAEMRVRNRKKFDDGQRKSNITRGSKLAEFNTLRWSRTIADIRFDNSNIYCGDIQRWAISILEDTDDLVRKLSLGAVQGQEG